MLGAKKRALSNTAEQVLYASKDKRKNLSTDERTVLFKSALQLAHARCIAPSERFDQGHTSDITMSGSNYQLDIIMRSIAAVKDLTKGKSDITRSGGRNWLDRIQSNNSREETQNNKN